jgi:hypothetical protein
VGLHADEHAAKAWSKALRVLTALVGCLGGLVVASWIVIAAAHVDDSYHITHVSGAWMALAQAANDGDLYPPPYDGERFGGTRYMPLQILVYAGAGRIGGDELVSLKVAAYVVAALLLVVTYLVLRGLGCGRALSVGLTATVLVSFTGTFAATTVYGDALPVLLQIAALGLVARSSSRWAVAGAGALVALAFLTKVSAIWGLVAVAAYLLLRDRRKVPLFLGVAAAVAAASFAAVDLISEGRMHENLLEFAFAGGGGIRAMVLESPQKLVRLLEEDAAASWLLVPLALLGTGLALAERRLTIYHLGLAAAVCSLLVVLADTGTDFNHLVDLVVLLAVVTGAFAVRVGTNGERDQVLSALILVVLVVALAGSYQVRLRSDTREAASMLLGGATSPIYDPRPLEGLIQEGESVLSDDPFVPVSLGERPVIGDAFMLLRIADRHPEWRADLVRRIERHEFDKVVLTLPLDLTDDWWSDFHLGIEIATALAREYRPAGRVVGSYDYYSIYVPRDAAGTGS